MRPQEIPSRWPSYSLALSSAYFVSFPAADASMRAGRWDRSKLMGTELFGKTIGIVGLGRIGGEVATRAHAFGMTVVAYDPYVAESRFHSLRVRRAETLDLLLDEADVVTMHTPLTDETRGMIGRRELARVSPHTIVVNMARGGIIDEGAVVDALRAGTLRAAAIDAFTDEPLAEDSPLRAIPNLYLTPHMGASTIEAQRNVAVDACAAVRDVLLRGELARSLNIAEAGSAGWTELRPALELTQKLAATARAILASQDSARGGTPGESGVRAVGKIEVRTGDAFGNARGALLAAAAVGTLESVTEHDRLNVINARALAEARGIELSFTELSRLATDGERNDGSHAIEVRLSGGMRDVSISGVAHPGASPRITRIGAFHVDVHPRETLLILTNHDVPGVIGRVGTLLGENGVNIAEYHQARLAQGGEALAAVSVDGMISEATRNALLQLPDVRSATVVVFRRAREDS